MSNHQDQKMPVEWYVSLHHYGGWSMMSDGTHLWTMPTSSLPWSPALKRSASWIGKVEWLAAH